VTPSSTAPLTLGAELLAKHPAASAHLHSDAAIADIAQKCWNIAGRFGERGMSLLIVYVALVITGDFVAYFIGLIIERTVPVASLPAFLGMYFLLLWVAWIIAVRVTQPRVQPQ
jgi:CDP-diglyceride synthetase